MPDSWNSCHWSDNSHQVQQLLQYYKFCEYRKYYRSIALTTLIMFIDESREEWEALQIFSEACESKIEIHISYLTRCSVSYKWTFQILKRVLDKVRDEYGRDSLLATYISHPLLSKRGAGGIDGLASWPQLCAPLMVAFGPTDDQQVPLSLAVNGPLL